MKKTIKLKIDLKDPFFLEIEKNLSNISTISDPEYINSIKKYVMSGVLKTIRSVFSKDNISSRDYTFFSYDCHDKTLPFFYYELENNIDVALNRKIHNATLESIAYSVIDSMNEYADNQNKTEITPLIDPNNEINAIIKYIQTTWNGFDDEKTPYFFQSAWDKCNDLLKYNFDSYAFTNLVEQLFYLKDEPSFKINNIDSKNLPFLLLISVGNLKKEIFDKFSHDEKVSLILKDVQKEFPDFKNAKPKNWNKLAKNYSDYDGMEELNSNELEEIFEGTTFETAVAPSFPIQTSLPHVMYNDKCQSRKPLETIIGAMLTHSYCLNESNNTNKMLSELLELKNILDNNKGEDISFNFNEPLNKALFKVIENDGKAIPEQLQFLNKKPKKMKI